MAKRPSLTLVDRLSLDETVGLNLKAARLALGLSQKGLAKVLGVTERAVGNYETGTRLIPPHTALRMKRTYGVPLDWLYAGDISGCRQDLAGSILVERAKLP